MSETQDVGWRGKDPESRYYQLFGDKYVDSLDGISLPADSPASGLFVDTYVTVDAPQVLKVLRDPMHMSGNGLLSLEIFEQNALALEWLARPASDVFRCPQLITRGRFNGKPAQVETNLVYNTGAHIGDDLEEELRGVTMEKRFNFYLSLLTTLWLQDTRGVVTYDVKPSNLGTYGGVRAAEQFQPDQHSVTILDFGASWVDGSPYNVVERQEAYGRCRGDVIDTISGIEASAVRYWATVDKMVTDTPAFDFEASKKRYAVRQERNYQTKHAGKLVEL